MTSRDLVNIVNGRVRVESKPRSVKVGHSGTLDPLAQGVLVMGIGIASRLTPYVQEHRKRYRTLLRFGASSISGDLEESLTEYPDLPLPSREQLEAACASFVGMVQQRPPVHSAVRVDGKRGYEHARRGSVIEMPTRTVNIHSIEIVSLDGRDCELDVWCGSGTYIRSLVMDIAESVGNKAVMTGLIRTAVGTFTLDEAIFVETIRTGPLSPHLRPLIDGVVGLPRLQVDELDVHRLRNGLFVTESTAAINDDETVSDTNEAIIVDRDGHLRGIVRREDGFWKPYRIFHEP